MKATQQNRKNKIELLKGIAAGTRSLNELLPQMTYLVFSSNDKHEVMHYLSKEVIAMNKQEYNEWCKKYKATWIKNSKHIYLTRIV